MSQAVSIEINTNTCELTIHTSNGRGRLAVIDEKGNVVPLDTDLTQQITDTVIDSVIAVMNLNIDRTSTLFKNPERG